MFRGKYKKLAANGVPQLYISGDAVLFEGNIYKAVKPTTKSPFTEPQNWKYEGVGTIYTSDTPPVEPKLGQLWENNGIVYTYYYDSNGFAWVQF